MTKTRDDWNWTQPVSELEKEVRILLSAVEVLQVKMERLEKGFPVVTYANITKTEADIRADERGKWAAWACGEAEQAKCNRDTAKSHGDWNLAARWDSRRCLFDEVAQELRKK